MLVTGRAFGLDAEPAMPSARRVVVGSPPSRVLAGRYKLVKHLASGGMAQVMLARTTGLEGFERYVVVKQIHVERARDPHVVKMFLDEARLAASLHHANIVQVHDVGQDQGEYFIAMEYIHGEDLRALLSHLSASRKHLPLEYVVTIVSAAAAALHHAHEQRGPDRAPLGLVHHDISPANILVGYDGNVKVVDFGIAKAMDQASETHSAVKGKISYMSPEQCTGRRVDRRTDVFALGIVLYELYTVRRLFKAKSDFLTMSAILTGKIPPPSCHRPDLPAELDAITMKALALSPDDRFQTADELRVALDRFARNHGLRTSTTLLADYMIEQFGRRPEPWLVADTSEVLASLDADFDDSASGVATVSAEVPINMPAAPSSPLARARSAETAGRQVPAAEAFTGAEPSSTGTPMAWPVPPSPLRRSWILASALLALGAGIAVAIVTVGNKELTHATPVTPTAPTSAVVAPSPAAAPPVPPTPTPTAAEATGSATASAPVAATPTTAAPPAPDTIAPAPTGTTTKRKPLRKPRPATTSTTTWDPDTLFPESGP